MPTQKRTIEEITIDEVTADDTLNDADLSSAEVVISPKSKKVPLNIRIEDEVIQLCKQIAAVKHLDGYTQLIRMYIWEGIEKDRDLLERLKTNR